MKNSIVKKSGLTALALVAIGLPLQSFAVSPITQVCVFNNLHVNDDPQAIGITGAPIKVQFFNSVVTVPTATVPCLTTASVLPGGSTCATATGTCSLASFIITPLASNALGNSYPYGSTPIAVPVSTLVPTASTPAFMVFDTNAATATTVAGVVDGVPGVCTLGTPVGTVFPGAGGGLTDTSVAPLVNAAGFISCAGVPAITLLPTLD